MTTLCRPIDLSTARRFTASRWIAVAAAVITAMTMVAMPQPGRAQAASDELPSTSFMTPFPPGDTYRLRVYGDYMADRLADSLLSALADEPRVVHEEAATRVDGLTRANWDEAIATVEAPGAKGMPEIVVVMLGINDRAHIRVPGQRRVQLGSSQWKDAYSQRIDRLMRALRKEKSAVYWVSLPILRGSEADEFAQTMNDVFRERAFRNGIKLIDVYTGFIGENGGYSAYGPDLEGDQKLLRLKDGINFTAAGAAKLAHFVEREIKRDLSEAMRQRNVPLLGSEADLRRIARPARQVAAAANTPGTPDTNTATATTGRAPQSFFGQPASSPAPRARTSSAADQKAENSRVTLRRSVDGREETIVLEIARPAIPAAVLDLVARRDDGQKPTLIGETVSKWTPQGTALMVSLTPSGIGTSGPSGLVPTQSTYVKVLAKGEYVAPPAGRADDFSWRP